MKDSEVVKSKKHHNHHHNHHHHHHKVPHHNPQISRTLSMRVCDDHHKPKDEPQGEPPKTLYRSVCLVLEGSAEVRNPFDFDYKVFELSQGEHFGATDLLQIPDIDYMGDIYAGPRGLKVLVIERPDQVIQLYERRNLQEKLKHNYDTLKLVLENKYFVGAHKVVFGDY